MSARPITPEIYAAAMAFFRRNPGNHTGAAQHLGLDRRTALRLWEGPAYVNWPWARPISVALREEQEKANAQALAAEEEAHRAMLAEQEKARRIAREAADIDDNILRLSRNNMLHALASAAKVASGMSKLAERVGDQLVRGTDSKGNVLPDMSPREFMRVLKDFAGSQKVLIEAAQVLQEIERLKGGLPTQIVGLELADMTDADIDRELSLAQYAVIEARRVRGEPVLVEGQGVAASPDVPQESAQE